MKTMRDKYFENYEKIQTPADNRRGFKTEYRYKGYWYAWDLSEGELKKERWIFVLAELVSLVVLFAAAMRQTELNTVKIAAGLATLSFIPYLAELWGVFRFITGKTPMTEADYTGIRDCMTIGSSIRAVLLFAAMIAGIVVLAGKGLINAENMAACAGHIASAAVSVFVLLRQGKRRPRMYQNVNGRPGPEL